MLLLKEDFTVKYSLRRFAETPFVSVALVCINVIIYMLDGVLDGRLVQGGNLNAFDVLVKQENGRILWAMFLHADMDHLFNNMIILLFMGAMLEREVGHTVFSIIYILSGICGNISSLAFKVLNDQMSISIGASGAVFGLDGLLLALVLLSGKKITTVTSGRVVVMVLLSLYNGFASTDIDNAAHVGGVFSGFILGCLVCMLWRIRESDIGRTV